VLLLHLLAQERLDDVVDVVDVAAEDSLDLIVSDLRD
jgi:hypothetical protein